MNSTPLLIVEVSYTVNIWRFLFDKRNRDVSNAILRHLKFRDYYNLWAAIFNWCSSNEVCSSCYKYDRLLTCCRVCHGWCCVRCLHSNDPMCKRCDALADQKIFRTRFSKRSKVEDTGDTMKMTWAKHPFIK